MRFWLLGLAVLVAVALIVSALASLAAAWAHARLRARLALQPAAVRARRLLALALVPSLAGLTAAALAALAWLAHEPRLAPEQPGLPLLFVGGAGLGLLAGRVAAAVRDVLRVRAMVARFRREGGELAGLPLPALRATHPFPVAALAGVWRPRLLVSEGVLAALEADELEAVVAHELAHLGARDNLKRLLLAASPDPLALSPWGRRLRAEHFAAAEAAADAHAATRVPAAVLAAAIVKVASLVPASGRLDLATAAFHDEGSLAARVHALVGASAAARPELEPTRRPRAARLATGALLAALLGSGLALLAPLHALLERLVRLLA